MLKQRVTAVAWLYAGVGTISAATMILKIALTRVFSVARWYHFAFLSISVSLLGYGASGESLALRRSSSDGDNARDLPLASLGFCLGTAAAFYPPCCSTS